MSVACSYCGADPTAIVTASWSFRVGRPIHSMNLRIVNSGASRWQYAKERDVWVRDLSIIKFADKIPTATGLRRVKLTRVYTGRQKRMDVGNWIGGAKVCLDAMVRSGLLQNDDPAHCLDYYQQRHDCHWGGVEFVLEELA